VSVHDVAASLLDVLGPTDPLKLQKLVYLVAGEYIAVTGSAMFREPTEAWDYGPVVYDLYVAYRDITGIGPIEVVRSGDAEQLDEIGRSCVRSVAKRFGSLSGVALVNLTHRHAAWRRNYVPGQYRRVIPNEELRAEFLEKGTGGDRPGGRYDEDMSADRKRDWQLRLTPAQVAVVRDLMSRVRPAPPAPAPQRVT
jgi:uncharacterized phage-associated protein